MDLNSAFKQTCKLLLGQEIGELHEFEPYLKEALIGEQVKSGISGKELWITYGHYASGSRFFDYATEYQQLPAPKLNINEIKDIDSLFAAVREQAIYSGNKVLGNSSNVEKSDNVSDSSFVLNSSIVIRSKFIAYSYLERDAEYAFGCTSSGNQSSHIIRCLNTTLMKRCFECADVAGCSDSYFCYNVMGSSNCMFCFNMRNKNSMVGNVQLTRDGYAALKAKLIAEMADELKRKKRLGYSIVDLLGAGV